MIRVKILSSLWEKAGPVSQDRPEMELALPTVIILTSPATTGHAAAAAAAAADDDRAGNLGRIDLEGLLVIFSFYSGTSKNCGCRNDKKIFITAWGKIWWRRFYGLEFTHTILNQEGGSQTPGEMIIKHIGCLTGSNHDDIGGERLVISSIRPNNCHSMVGNCKEQLLIERSIDDPEKNCLTLFDWKYCCICMDILLQALGKDMPIQAWGGFLRMAPEEAFSIYRSEVYIELPTARSDAINVLKFSTLPPDVVYSGGLKTCRTASAQMLYA
ncbi:hypothetical protein Cgig2_023989 [Carnegiea gigantea]|uniref:Uncharacterized protein n=1 Tax=Carnegiea gigantea TaxID=171969 RepID=A0A9Q1KB31_9CARY|nr:hypothetical protein Cgig2_023989 [Carnegiea gigantea]